jgi:hypothetical protein
LNYEEMSRVRTKQVLCLPLLVAFPPRVIAVNKNILIKSVFVFFAHTTFLQKISFELYYFCAVTPHLHEQKKFSLELDILSIIHQHQIVYS